MTMRDDAQWVVNPFPGDDLLVYQELTPEWRALRALLAVLADTGAAVEFPVELAPGHVPVEVAVGWRMRSWWEADPDRGTVLLRAQWVAAPEIPEPTGEGR
jgi:hypothetical protein